jgi:hypothetical protein
MNYKPFDSSTVNYIELGNEIMVLACQYFMMIFACDIRDETLRANLGYIFSLLVLVHLIVGFIALLMTKIIKALPALKKLLMKIKEYWLKIKEKLSKKKVSKEQGSEEDKENKN